MRAPASSAALGLGLALMLGSACKPSLRAPSSPDPGGPGMQQSSNAALASDGVQRGQATFYGEKFRGRKTASGARFNPDAFTCAHRTLPFGTRVEVRRPDTGAAVQVVVTDRGPFGSASRIVDLSLAAARALNMTKLGVVSVELRVLGR